jgi:hypothetical protein
MWLTVLKLLSAENWFFLFKIFTSPPLGLCQRGWPHHYTHLPQLYHCTQMWQKKCKLINALTLNSMAMISRAFRFSHQWLWWLLSYLVTCDTMWLVGQVPPKYFLFPTTKHNNQKNISLIIFSPQFSFSKNKTA